MKSNKIRDTKKTKSAAGFSNNVLTSFFTKKLNVSPEVESFMQLDTEIVTSRKNTSTGNLIVAKNEPTIDQSKQQLIVLRKRTYSKISTSSRGRLINHDTKHKIQSIDSNDASTAKQVDLKERRIPLGAIKQDSKYGYGFQSAWMMALQISDSVPLSETTDKENNSINPLVETLISSRKNERNQVPSTSNMKCQQRATVSSGDSKRTSQKVSNGKTLDPLASSFNSDSNVPISQVTDSNQDDTTMCNVCQDAKNIDKIEDGKKHYASSKNIVHQILIRTISGNGRYQMLGNTTKIQSKHLSSLISRYAIESNSQLQFHAPKAVPWLELVPKGRNECTFCCWDDMGVLLAAVYGYTTIRIYDWDTVLAADIAGKNLSMRQLGHTESNCAVISIQPIITIDIRQIITNSFGDSNLITFLQWNPSNQDEIMVGSRFTSKTYIVNLNEANSWMESSRKSNTANQRLPYQEICCNGLNLNKYSKFVFVDTGRCALLASETTISFYQFDSNSSNRRQPSKRLWSFKPWQQQAAILITDLSVISDEIILVGSSHGQMALINWKKMQRTSSFTNSVGPTLIEKWISYKGISCDHPNNMMGIHQLHTTLSFNNNGLLCFNFSWTTTGGWILMSSVEVISSIGNKQKQSDPIMRVKRSATEVIFRTNLVRCYNNEGKEVHTSKETFCLPLSSHTLQTCRTLNGGYFIEAVPDVSMILPNRDNRVAGEQQVQIIRNSKHKPTIHFIQPTTKFVSKLLLPRRLFSEGLSSIAVHPSSEWIVIGSPNVGLIIYNAR